MTSIEARLRTGGGLKWGYYDEDVLPAWVAEMDFGLAPAITDALHDAVDRGITGYPYPAAEQRVAVAASRFWADRFGWVVEPSWVFPAPDVIEGGVQAIRHLTRPEAPVVLHSPVYFPFFGMVERAGREVIEVRCRADDSGRFTLNLPGIDAALADGAGSVVLCNPWNPTGRVLTETELGDLIEVVARHDARLIADEIHAPIVYAGNVHTPVATLDPELAITITSASKAWNLPGLKCAQVVLTNEDDRALWSALFSAGEKGGTLGLIANAAAYESGVEWFQQTLKTLESNRDLLAGVIAEYLPETVCFPPQGTYLAWLDMSRYDLGDPTAYLLDEARVALTPGAPFGSEAGQFSRFNFATDPSLITEMVERMAKALRGR